MENAKQILVDACQWAGTDYGSKTRATAACVRDWITGCGSVPLTRQSISEAIEAGWNQTAAGWFSLEVDEDGVPVVDGPSRVSGLAEVIEIATALVAEDER